MGHTSEYIFTLSNSVRLLKDISRSYAGQMSYKTLTGTNTKTKCSTPLPPPPVLLSTLLQDINCSGAFEAERNLHNDTNVAKQCNNDADIELFTYS